MFKNINKIVKVMVTADMIFYAGWGLINPILAIYIIGSVKGGNVEVVGIGVGVYWILKSIIQIPLAYFLDNNHGEKDDYYVWMAGMVIVSLTPLGFIFISLPYHLYLLQAIYALGMAMIIPSWSGIFTRHIEKRREAFCWGIESSGFSIGAGVGGIAGGIVANAFGFVPLFIAVSVIGFMSMLLLLSIKSSILPKERIYPIPKP
jgi:DHA1 family multidrug resistance protein-like MFS transporter